MAKEWNVACKDCGKIFGYSDWSYQAGAQIGHSRPERCPEHRKIHNRQASAMGLAYFKLKPRKGVDTSKIRSGSLGAISHPPREHEIQVIKGNFDPRKFGVSETDIKKVFEWFSQMGNQVAVVEGPTGSGKSTALPYYLINPPDDYPEDFFTRYGQVVVTQPRIQATRNIPAYVAKELFGSSIGSGFDIGFRYSNHPYSDWRNRLVYLTDGTLINWIVNGQISRISLVMIDEAHERTLNIDLILGLMKKLLPRYPNLKLIIASATIDAELFATYFGKEKTKVIKFEGMRKYNVQEFYQEEDSALPYEEINQLKRNVSAALAEKVLWLLKAMENGQKEPGDILGFLHGEKPIEEAVTLIRNRIGKETGEAHGIDVYPLYTKLPQEEQNLALLPKKDKERRRVVITTNVAETSLTVEGIVYVIDSGLINESQWDPQTETKQVIPVLHSKAGCIQRWGRAGRVRDGEAFCLYTKSQFDELFPDYTIPQIQRSPLDQIVLTAKAAGIHDLESFEWIQPPPFEELQRTPEVLRKMGALDEDGDVTEYGLELQNFAEEPLLANLMTYSDKFSCSIEMATIISMMKAGGIKHYLKWNNNWNADTKFKVSRLHEALKQGCKDDIEFCLKLFSIWEEMEFKGQPLDPYWAFRITWEKNMPNFPEELVQNLGEEKTEEITERVSKATGKSQIVEIISEYNLEQELKSWMEGLDKGILDSQREAWGKAMFINHSIIRDKVAPDRDVLLDSLSGHKKEDERRPIDFDLIDRVRMVIAFCMQDWIYKIEGNEEELNNGNKIEKLNLNVDESANSEEPKEKEISALAINNDSLVYGRTEGYIASLKHQVIVRSRSIGEPPQPILHLSFNSFVDGDWLSGLKSSHSNLLSLGMVIASTIRDPKSGQLKIQNQYEKLFIDQAYPLDSIYEFEISQPSSTGDVLISPVKLISQPPPIIESFRKISEESVSDESDDEENLAGIDLVDTVLSAEDLTSLVENPEEEFIPAWVDQADDTFIGSEGDEILYEQEPKDSKEDTLNLQNGIVWKIANEDTNDRIKENGKFYGRIIGYSYENDVWQVLVKIAPDGDPFDTFLSKYKVGDTVEVELAEYFQRPGDYFVAWVVNEKHSGLECLVEPTHVNFDGRSSTISEVPIGSMFEMTVMALDNVTKKAKLSVLPQLERHLRKLRSDQNLRSKAQINARVVEINYVRERVYLIIDDWSSFEDGLVSTISIGGGGLHKPVDVFELGEIVGVEIDFSDRFSTVDLSSFPDDLIEEFGL